MIINKWLQVFSRQVLEVSQASDSYLCVSGGVDSQCMVQVFQLFGYSPRLVHFQFENGLNHHENESVQLLRKKLHLAVEIIPVRIMDLLRSEEFYTLASGPFRSYPGLALFFLITRELGGMPVFSGEPPQIVKLEQQIHRVVFREFDVLQTHLKQEGRFCIPGFFRSSEDIIQSFFHLTPYRMQQWALESAPKLALHPYDFKLKVYRELGLEIMNIPKFHGLEIVLKKYLNDTNEKWAELFRNPVPSPFVTVNF